MPAMVLQEVVLFCEALESNKHRWSHKEGVNHAHALDEASYRHDGRIHQSLAKKTLHVNQSRLKETIFNVPNRIRVYHHMR